MPQQGGFLLQIFVIPNINFVVTEPMGGYNLIFLLTKDNVADLTLRILHLKQLVVPCIEYSETSIRSTSPGGQDASFPFAPIQSLHGRLVLLFHQREFHLRGKDKKLIVVTP